MPVGPSTVKYVLEYRKYNLDYYSGIETYTPWKSVFRYPVDKWFAQQKLIEYRKKAAYGYEYRIRKVSGSKRIRP